MKRTIATIFAFGLAVIVQPVYGHSGTMDGISGCRPLETAKEVVKSDASETAFGRDLLEMYESNGISLPIPVDKILRLRPGTGNAAPEPLDKPLVFAGFNHYTEKLGRLVPEYGYFTFSTDNMTPRPYGKAEACINRGGVYAGRRLMGFSNIPVGKSNDTRWRYYEWDEDTWKSLGESGLDISDNDIVYYVRNSAYDPVSGSAYGCGSEQVFTKIDYNRLTTQILGYTDVDISAMVFDSEGKCWAVSVDGNLCNIDKSNGKVSVVGSLGFPFMPAYQSLAFDKDGNLYLSCAEIDEENYLYMGRISRIDLTTGKATLLGYFPYGEQFNCLRVLDRPEDMAPGSPEDLSVAFRGPDSKANVNFTIPSESVDGSWLSGKVNYEIIVNDDKSQVVTGSGYPGDWVAKSINVPGNGRMKITINLSNEYGEGKSKSIESWGGLDTVCVRNLKFIYDDRGNSSILSWKCDNVGANGGYADADGAVFDIVRYPDGVQVASGLEDCEFIDDVAGLPFEAYRYEVTPVINGVSYKSEVSGSRLFGTGISVPYSDSFDDDDNARRYSFIDDNRDGKTWEIQTDWMGNGIMWYEFDSFENADDWALTPPIHMKNGMSYRIRFNASGLREGTFEEILSAGIGTGENVHNYSTLMPETVITSSFENPDCFEFLYIPEKEDDYRVGFHCLSKANNLLLIVDNLSVEEAYDTQTPDCVENFAVRAHEKGELATDISFDAPTSTLGGETLKELSVIKILRSGSDEPVAAVENPEPGKHYLITDKEAANGPVSYTVIAFNNAGAGMPASAETYVGIDVPSAPASVSVTDNLDGSATISWIASDMGVNGGYVDTDDLLYNIYAYSDGEPVLIRDNVDRPSFDVNAPENGPQNAVKYLVSAVNELGESEYSQGNVLFYGAPVESPFMEGFVSYDMKNLWYFEGNAGWYLVNGISSDGDNSAVSMQSETESSDGWFTSGKISMPEGVNPVVCFAYYVTQECANSLDVYAIADGSDQKTSLGHISLDSGNQNEGWLYAVLPLADVSAKRYVNIAFHGIVSDTQTRRIFIDDVNVRNMPENNLALYLTADNRTTGGTCSSGTVTVLNAGIGESDACEIDLMVGGKVVDTIGFDKNLGFMERAATSVSFPISVTMSGEVELAARLRSEADMEKSDDMSVSSIEVFMPTLPCPTNLCMAVGQNEICLEWEGADIENNVEETFESYASFSNGNIGQWNVVDGDGEPITGINGLNYPLSGKPAAFFPMDFGVSGIDLEKYPEFAGVSGTQFIAAVRPVGGVNDDWLISPELSGEAQRISFYARTLAYKSPDTYEVCISSSGSHLSDFKVLATETADDDFRQKHFEIPAGTKRFAIHCKSTDGGILGIDDIRFKGKPLTLKGYKIYRDDEPVASVDGNTLSYRVNSIPGTHTYRVGAVFEEGESALSNTVKTLGIDEIGASSLKVSGHKGCIIIENCNDADVAIYDMTSAKVFDSHVDGNCRVEMSSGVYIVMIRNNRYKVMVN